MESYLFSELLLIPPRIKVPENTLWESLLKEKLGFFCGPEGSVASASESQEDWFTTCAYDCSRWWSPPVTQIIECQLCLCWLRSTCFIFTLLTGQGRAWREELRRYVFIISLDSAVTELVMKMLLDHRWQPCELPTPIFWKGQYPPFKERWGTFP